MTSYATAGDVQAAVDELERRLKPLITQLQGPGPLKIGDFTVAGPLLSFIKIPQTYRHLRIIVVGQSQRAAFANTGLRYQFGTPVGQIATGFQTQYWGYGSNPAGVVNGQLSNDTRGYLGQTPAATRASDAFVSTGVIDIPFYAQAGVVKTFLADVTMHDGTSLFQSLKINTVNTATSDPITRFDIFDDVSGALGPRAAATLYGIP